MAGKRGNLKIARGDIGWRFTQQYRASDGSFHKLKAVSSDPAEAAAQIERQIAEIEGGQ